MYLARYFKKTLISFLCLLSITACTPSADIERELTASRDAVKQLGSKLKAELTAGMQSGGPVEALSICNIQAEKIASHVSNDLNLEVGRTSLKVRSSNNISDDWEQEVLLYFEKQKQSGTDINTLETHEIIKDETGKWFRYMKAIPTADVCLICHGEVIAPPIQEKLESLYPNDQAKGFKVGDIRGAFSVRIKMQ